MIAEGKGAPPDKMKGWLYKWTNYIKGYQRRWFVLANGHFAYYRTKEEMGHTCRGVINLEGAYIEIQDSSLFVISCGAQTFHLRASSEVECQKWVLGLEMAKASAIEAMENESDEEMAPSSANQAEFQNTFRKLAAKLEDLGTCNDLIIKHGTALQRTLSELENIQDPTEALGRSKVVSERATLFKITSNAMINACHEFLEVAQTNGKKWQKALQYEQEKRKNLEETIETLAKQHNLLEKACREAKTLENNINSTKGGDENTAEVLSDDDENEFFDAIDEPEFTTTVQVPGPLKSHRRTPSQTSSLSIASSEGAGHGDQEMPSSDEDNMHEPRLEASVVTVGRGDASNNVSALMPRSNTKSKRERRKKIPFKPNFSLNLWSIIKNCIGKELSRIPMPVNVNEPLSMLQRLAEDMEFADLLDAAAMCTDTCEELAVVAGYTASVYSYSNLRTTKPFNPLLGETYECDRSEDLGWKFLAEQVSHHPPAAAYHCKGRGWQMWVDVTITSKFRGKYLQVFPKGITHLTFDRSGSHYTYPKVLVTVHNIIVGKLWVDLSGDCDIVNHTTKENCRLTYKPSTYFNRDTPRKVTGVVVDNSGSAQYIVSGTWDRKMEYAKVVNVTVDKTAKQGKQVYETGPPKLIWQRHQLPPDSDKMYNLSELAITLNEIESGVAPTDSRFRPDQRLMEEGLWDAANTEKLRLEDKQRLKRKKRETDAAPGTDSGLGSETYMPNWFERRLDPLTDTVGYYYNNQYWECKEKQDWSRCPDIF